MSITHDPEPTRRQPLRLWPGLTLAALIVLISVVLPAIAPEAEVFGMPLGLLGFLWGAAAGLLIVLWWAFFSRAPWSERLGAMAVMIAAVAVTRLVLHESVAGAGMGMLFFFYAIPTTTVALVLWAAASGRLPAGSRRASMVAAILLGCGVWALVRTGGITGEGDSDFHWRWTPTAEERLLAQAPLDMARGGALESTQQGSPESAQTGAAVSSSEARPAAPPAAHGSTAAAGKPASPAGAETPEPRAPAAAEAPGAHRADPGATRAAWPGFRGEKRDGVVHGLRIETDWSRTPPVELWRRPIGPGWSSFAVHGDLIYTQEQRGDHEIVSCYRLSTGEPVWMHSDAVRFYESNGGAGPRATPTLHDGRVYTLGATGILNALDARTGALVWSRNAAGDTGKSIPDWGVASSPVIVDDVVIAAVSGRLAGYDAGTGNPRWLGPEGGGGYSSPHAAAIDGVPQVLLLRGSRTVSVAPTDGTLLWEHAWERSVSIVQPAVTVGGDVLIAAGDATGMGGMGIRRIGVARTPDGWRVEERWTSRALKPYFNDFVAHDGHAYGFDGSILACMDLEDGARKWKGGRYGYGQLVLLPEQDLLIVVTEEGEVALVRAAPDGFAELARFKAIEGKTWNHPAIAGDVLLVRNGEEMAAFRLTLAGR